MEAKNNKGSVIELQPFYMKDASRIRDLAGQYYPPMTLNQWREEARQKMQRGEGLFFVVRDGEDIGGINVASPFGSKTWSAIRMWVKTSLAPGEMEEILRQVLGDDEDLYRIDVMFSDTELGMRGKIGRMFEVDWPINRLTYYVPQIVLRQVAFIPWVFGYLVVVTTPDRERIESIQFMRKGKEGLTTLVKQTAYYRGLLGFDGIVAGQEDPFMEDECDILKLARSELSRYLAGGHLPDIPYEFPKGTAFQEKVWRETLKIPYGAVRTYADIAAIIEPDKSKSGQMARAVGRALGANPLPILIPCHRVIGSNRDLTGFGGGVDIKEHLLQLEMWDALAPS